jgi:hypothetical protein
MKDNLKTIINSLKRIQKEGGAGNFVIFTADANKNYYIQFAGEAGSSKLYAEAVSNNYLPPQFRLGEKQIIQLQSIGWNTPPPDGVNFYREWHAKTDEDRLIIAQEIMHTFVEVYGLNPNQSLNVELVLDNIEAEYTKEITPDKKEVGEILVEFNREVLEVLETKGTGIFFYSDKPTDSVSVTWRLNYGEKLSNKGSWRAEIIIKNFGPGEVYIMDALMDKTVCKLMTAEGAVFPCKIYDIDHIIDGYPTIYFEVCSLDQQGAELYWKE